MKQFKFNLQKVMEVRKNQEDVQKRKLAKVRKSLDAEQDILDHLLDERLTHMKAMRNSVKKTITACEMSRLHDHLSRLVDRVVSQARKVQDLESAWSQRRATLMKTSKEKKALGTLREKQYVQYRRKISEIEQKFLDELSHRNFQGKGISEPPSHPKLERRDRYSGRRSGKS